MVRFDWRTAFATMGRLSDGNPVKVNVPAIDTNLRRDLEDSQYVLPKTGSEDIIELLKEI